MAANLGEVLIHVVNAAIVDGGVDARVVGHARSGAREHRVRDARKSDAIERIGQAQGARDLVAPCIRKLAAIVSGHGDQGLAEERGREGVSPVGDAAVVHLAVDIGVGAIIERRR